MASSTYQHILGQELRQDLLRGSHRLQCILLCPKRFGLQGCIGERIEKERIEVGVGIVVEVDIVVGIGVEVGIGVVVGIEVVECIEVGIGFVGLG